MAQSRFRRNLGFAFRRAAFHTPLKRFILYRYEYNMTPEALGVLVQCITETRDVPGMIVEVGCDRGHTTAFLNRHMTACKIEKPYLCIDTFEGFVEDDIAHEIERRGKVNDYSGFSVNSVKWFNDTMSLNGIDRVTAVKTDIKQYEFAAESQVSFALIDVDIYQPTVNALTKIYPLLAPGGIIAVDDCHNHTHYYDGAAEAYQECVQSHGIAAKIEAGRIGLIRRPLR